MEHREYIVGLGSHSGHHLLEALNLRLHDEARISPEFTYLGVFLSGLCYKTNNSSTNELLLVCMEEFRALHAQLGTADATALNALAESALSDYLQVLHVWPTKSAYTGASINICTALTMRLQTHHGVSLPVLMQAKMRHLISEQLEILETAYEEILLSEKRPPKHQPNKVHRDPLINNENSIATQKSQLLQLFEDGEITASEYQTNLDELYRQEREALTRKAICEPNTKYVLPYIGEITVQKLILLLTASLAFGFLLGSMLSPKLFGYNNAEECIIAKGGSRGVVAACYELYPSIADVRENGKDAH